MKRERLEDLGRIYERLDQVMTNDFWDMFQSKHGVDIFVDYEKENADVTFHNIKNIKYQLDEIMILARGMDEYD